MSNMEKKIPGSTRMQGSGEIPQIIEERKIREAGQVSPKTVLLESQMYSRSDMRDVSVAEPGCFC